MKKKKRKGKSKYICQNALHCGETTECDHSIPHQFRKDCWGGKVKCKQQNYNIEDSCPLYAAGTCFRVRSCLKIKETK